MPEAGISDDPLCAYSVLHALYQRDAAHLSTAERSVTRPVFRHSNGAAWTTTDVQDAVRDAATALGLDPKEFAGKSLRIGGATDLREKLGVADGFDHIRAAGRWRSADIGFIYARTTAAEHLDALERLGTGEGTSADLESLIPGWTQPAWRHA